MRDNIQSLAASETRSAPAWSLPGWNMQERILLGLVAGLIIYGAFTLWWTFGQVLLDAHSFRQTQTALSTYWMLKGGPLIAYETPVGGAPWVIPFEFPIFQYSAALLTFLGLPLEEAGRTAAFLYFVACAWPITMIAKDLGLGRFGALSLLALFFASPINIMCSHLFMIESCAVFFGLLYLALLLRASKTCSVRDALFCILVGSLCALTKSTTLPGFSLLAGFWFLYLAYQKLIMRRDDRPFWFLGLLGIALLLPYLVALGWIAYTDFLKGNDIFGAGLTSSSLKKWNYGELGLRFSEKMWHELMPLRVFPDILGYASIMGIGFILLACTSWRYLTFAVLSLISFIVPMMIFTNLHLHHNYYQAANAAFLVAAVAFSLIALYQIGKERLAVFVVVAIALSQVAYFHTRYFGAIRSTEDFRYAWYEIARDANEILPKDSAIYYFEYSWSSLIPFYAERKSVVLSKVRGQRLKAAFEDPSSVLGDMKLGGIIVCVPQPEEVQNYLSGREVLAERGRCKLYGN